MKDARDEKDPRLCEPVRQGPFWTVDCHDSAPLRHFRSRRRAQDPDAVAFFCEADSSSSFPRNPLRTRRRAGRWQCAAWKGAFHHGRWRESRRFRPGHRLSEDRLSRSRRRFERPSARCRPPRPAYAGGPPWIALIYEFYDQEGSDWFFEHAFGGMGPGLQGLRDDMEDRTYKQGIARYTPDEILGENRYLLGTDRPTSFDAVVFGMTILVYQLREMHPRLTDYARSLPNLTQYIGNLLTEFFPDLDRDFESLRSPVFYLKKTRAWSSNPCRLTPCQRFARVLSPPPASAAYLQT